MGSCLKLFFGRGEEGNPEDFKIVRVDDGAVCGGASGIGETARAGVAAGFGGVAGYGWVGAGDACVA